MNSAGTPVGNAGLVLTWPYLSHWFAMLGLTVDGGDHVAWRSAEAQQHAVRLTQMLVDGRFDAPDAELTLNRLLCGVADGQATGEPMTPGDTEAEEARALLTALIAHWGQLGQTSIAGLQESFLQRAGRIEERDGAPMLVVGHKPFDVLLDSLPWSVSRIALPWMPRPLIVLWR